MASERRLFSADESTPAIFDPPIREKSGGQHADLETTIQLLKQTDSPKPHFKRDSSLFVGAGTPVPLLSKTPLSKLQYEDVQAPATSNLLSETLSSPYTYNTSLLQNTLNASKVATPDASNMTIQLEKDPQMEGSGCLFGEFLQLFSQHPHSADIFDLVQEYENACRENVKSLLSCISKIDPSRRRLKKTVSLLNQLYQECYTWRLLGSLFRDRILSETAMDDDFFEDGGSMDSSQSEKIIIDRLFQQESGTRQCQIIIDWLEKNMQDKLEDMLETENLQFHSDNIYWEHTVHDLEQLAMGSKDPIIAQNLVTEIDPDAPIRQQRQLSPLDQQDEQQLLVYMLMFIKAGKLEEAQKLCINHGHSWRASSLDGWRLWHDPNFFSGDISEDLEPVEGNPNRDLWKLSSWEIADETFCVTQERAIYAALSGNLKQLLPSCSTWAECLWAYFKVLVDVRVEQEIRKHPRSTRPLEDMPENYWNQLNGNELTPQGIFDQLEAHPNQTIKKQCSDAFHVYQKNIILNEIDDLISSLKTHLSTENMHQIRFMAHLVLFLRGVGVQTKDDICVEVLQRYIEILIKSRQHDLVAVYTAQLPPDMQVGVYAGFLEGFTDKSEKQKYLELAEEAGLDLASITKRVVENIRLTEDDALSGSSITKADERKINSVEWLTYDTSQRAEALKQANAITRTFLAAKKMDAAQQVFSRIPSDSIDIIHKQWQSRGGSAMLSADDENAIKEYLSIKAYLDAHDAFNAWFEHYHHQAPVAPKPNKQRNFKDQIAHDQSKKEYEVEFERWQKTLLSHVKSTSERIYNVLLFPGGWLVDERKGEPSSDDRRVHQMLLLRQLCVPFMTMILHSVFSSAKLHKECYQLAEVIQSKRYRLYEVFQKYELQKFLQLLRDTSIALLDEGLDPLGYEKPS